MSNLATFSYTFFNNYRVPIEIKIYGNKSKIKISRIGKISIELDGVSIEHSRFRKELYNEITKSIMNSDLWVERGRHLFSNSNIGNIRKELYEDIYYNDIREMILNFSNHMIIGNIMIVNKSMIIDTEIGDEIISPTWNGKIYVKHRRG